MAETVLLRPFCETFIEEMREAFRDQEIAGDPNVLNGVIKSLCHQARNSIIPRMRIFGVIEKLGEFKESAPTAYIRQRIESLILHLEKRMENYLVKKEFFRSFGNPA